MSLTFSIANDGDVILLAGPDPVSKLTFCAHKVILSLASPVFKDMFTLFQPTNQYEEYQLPIIDIPEPPEVIDTLLRLIYPEAQPPKVPEMPTLAALLAAANKYKLDSTYPVLRAALKTFLPNDPFRVYVAACRFGFFEEAMEAARVGNPRSIVSGGIDEAVQHISGIHILRWVKLVQEREDAGRSMIEQLLSWQVLRDVSDCNHWEDGKDFYFRLAKAVVDAFSLNPCVGINDLLSVLNKVPDPPPGCRAPSDSGEFYYTAYPEEAFKCPLQPMTIRVNLKGVVDELEDLNISMVDEAFGGEEAWLNVGQIPF